MFKINMAFAVSLKTLTSITRYTLCNVSETLTQIRLELETSTSALLLRGFFFFFFVCVFFILSWKCLTRENACNIYYICCKIKKKQYNVKHE